MANDATRDVLSGIGAGSPNALLFTGGSQLPPPPDEPTATVPDAPTNVGAQAGIRSAVVIWTPPSDGGTPLTSQVIYVYDKRDRLVGTASTSPSVTSAEITGLKPNQAYSFAVAAMNTVGMGPMSARTSQVVVVR